MIVKTFIMEGRVRLEQASLQCADPLLHMKQIVEFGLGWSSTQLYLNWETALSPEQVALLNQLLEKRLTGQPFQYIAGFEWFWNSKFTVGPGVLIPRRETELLVEVFLKNADAAPQKVAELGAGSGNIGISILLERKQDQWHAFEKNPQSLLYAEKNKANLLLDASSYFLHEGDFFEKTARFAPYDWFVANPPYVASSSWNTLSREVQHEPRLALDGGPDGTAVIKKMMEAGLKWLKPGGRFLAEIGSEQKMAVEHLFRDNGYTEIFVLEDYAHLPRVAFARRGI